MANSFVLGNGTILLCFDAHGAVNDFYYPYVGSENHVGHGRTHRIGVWIDGEFSWMNDGSWNIEAGFERGTMASRIRAVNEGLQIEISFTDVVYNESNIFLRCAVVRNKDKKRREIRVFFSQQFSVGGTGFANTVYVHKDKKTVIHYKGRNVFLVSGMHAGTYFDDYSVGLAEVEGKEGTWKDAEDGILAKNAIEHGTVDSTIGFTLSIGADSEEDVYYWVTVGHTLGEATNLHEDVIKKTPAHIRESTIDYWHAWLSKRSFTFHGLSNKAADLFNTSLLVIRAHNDNHGGILASGDSVILQYGRDTYGYVWPRDGAITADALDKAGYFHIGERFYTFCNDLLSEDGYMLHKYNADRSFGSSWHPWLHDGKPQLAIQEDETALPLALLWNHYELTRDLEFVELIYNSFIVRAGQFLLDYRDPKTHLPLPSYDLWEERNGIHCFTASSVYGALVAVSRFAHLLGKEKDTVRFEKAAQLMKAAVLKYFYNKKEGYFIRSLWFEGTDMVEDTIIDSSSAYGIFRFGLLPSHDKRLVSAFGYTKEKLGVPLGDHWGLARYEGDMYYRVHNKQYPGNPWLVTTLWYVEYKISMAKTATDLEEIRSMLEWVADYTGGGGMLPEQINPYTGDPLSALPLTWSHSAYVLACIEYLKRLNALGLCITCYPIQNDL